MAPGREYQDRCESDIRAASELPHEGAGEMLPADDIGKKLLREFPGVM